MSLRVWPIANPLLHPEVGGHLWADWICTLGLSAAGYDVWLEGSKLDLTVGEHLAQQFAT
jgi:hypothetical protein